MSQEKSILKHMLERDHITMLEAFGVYRCFNLKGRIADLRIKHGKDFIHTEMCADDTGKKYARYSINPAYANLADILVYGEEHAEAA